MIAPQPPQDSESKKTVDQFESQQSNSEIIQVSSNTGIINTGTMGNVNTGSGTQLNVENQSAGRDINNIGQQIIMPKEPERVCPAPPPPPDKFGGRNQELRELMEKLKREQVVAITALEGLGGIGKTTLARKLAYELFHEQGAERCFRAVLWLDVTSEPNEERLLLELGGQVEVGFSRRANEEAGQLAKRVQLTLQQAIEGRCEHCRFDRVLLVLDDVWENGLELVERIKGLAPPKTTTLITTRFGKVANGLFAEARPLGRMSKEAGAEMLTAYLPGANRADLELLAEVLGGHALALRLAAGRLPRLGREKTLRQHIEDYRTKLHGGTEFEGLGLRDRVDALERALSYSYAELDEEEKWRFRALGVIAHDQPCEGKMLAALWGVEAEEVEQYIEPLYELGLLEAEAGEDPDAPEWFRPHPLLQSYARALLLRDKAEYAGVLARYEQYITEVAYQFWELPPEEWGQLGPYLPHIHSVGDGLANQVEAESGLEDATLVERALAFAYNIYSYVGLRREERKEKWLEMGLATSRTLQNQKCESLFLNELGIFYDALGEKDKALQYYEQALPLDRAIGDRGSEATTLSNIGAVYDALGEKDKALQYFEQALPLRRAVGNRQMEATTLNNIGKVYRSIGEPHKALQYFEQALPLNRAVDDRGAEAVTLSNIGGVYYALGEKDKALQYYEQALPLRRAVGDRGGEATTLNNFGMVYHTLGEQDKALQYYEQALPLFRAVGDRSGEAVTCFNMAMAYRYLRQLEKAVIFLERCVGLDEQIRHPDLESDRALLEEVRVELE
jgi:tetratricopeptide (TPR) repeat protein